MKLQYRDLFSNTVSTFGYQLYKNGKIKNINIDAKVIKAQIVDQDTYQVVIQYYADQIWKMTCTCPFSDFGYNCMHMASVCMYLEEINFDMEGINREGLLKEIKNPDVDLNERKEQPMKKTPYQNHHQVVLDMDLNLFPNQEENDFFFQNLVIYADLLLLDGESVENVLSLMKKYKRNYGVFKWLIDCTHKEKKYLNEIQLIDEGISWCKNHNEIEHVNYLYETRKNFYHNL